jgi:hypothetical protein
MRRFFLAFIALTGIGVAAAVADYTATQGAGTTFGSAVQATVHYAKWVLCDLTAPATQCATVSAAGALKVDGSAATQPVSGTVTVTGTVTANAGTNLNTSALALDATVATTNTDLGAPGSTACATDNGSCNLNALAQRQAQRLTTINTTLGTPFQAGGSIGNTTFASTQSGTWTVQPGNTANTTAWLVTGSGGTFPVTATNLSTNINQINGVTPLMGNGATGTGSPRVTIASDNTPFSVNATLSAETTKVIGTVNIAAAQSITATQATAANLNATVVGTGTFAVQSASTLAAETTKVIGTVRNLGNAGAITDFAGQNATSPANSWLIGGQFNTTPTTITSGNSSPLQLDNAGNLKVNVTVGGGTGGTSSTFGAAFPATGTAIGMTQGGNMVALSGTSGNLNVQCANCSGSGVSTVDEATFTAGTSIFAGTGGFFQTTATNNALTNGQQGMWQMTANRAGFVNLRNAAGAEVGVTGAELFVGGRGTAGTAAGGVLTVQGVASMTKLLVTPDSVALPANQSVNVSQINGVTTLMGNGATGTGSQRITIANDNTLPTGWASSVAIASTTSGQTGPLAQCAVTTAAPTYTTAQTDPLSCDTAGSLRTTVTNANVNGQATMANSSPVVIASNQSAIPVTLTSTTLTGTSAVNVAQINGVTPLMGNGVTGTGSQRVTIASDNTAFSVNATLSAETTKVIGTVRNVGNAGAVFDAATGAAPPANTVAMGAVTSGATGGLMQIPIQCDSTAIYDASTNGKTELKALTAGRTIYVCGYTIMASGTVSVSLVYGTGTACATGETPMTPPWQLTTQVGLVDGAPFSRGLKTASANALCIKTSAGVSTQAIVYYAVI